VLSERPWRLRWDVTTSGRGASVGRNVGLRAVSAPVVAFPDDDAWYPRDTLGRVIDAFTADPLLTALCGRQITSSGRGSMLRWKSRACLVTPYNFMRTSIMSTMFFRRSWLDTHEQFDEGMGVGSAGWYGACEESDLLLRVIEDGHRVPYDPSLLVLQEEPREDPDERFVAKMLSYGCGQGYLWRKRSLPRSLFVWYCARKLVAASVRAARGDRLLARADLAWLRGNVAGLRDIPPKELRHRAGVR
jgi:glycosyltransferase involved in cell wall biosynthesis